MTEAIVVGFTLIGLVLLVYWMIIGAFGKSDKAMKQNGSAQVVGTQGKPQTSVMSEDNLASWGFKPTQPTARSVYFKKKKKKPYKLTDNV